MNEADMFSPVSQTMWVALHDSDTDGFMDDNTVYPVVGVFRYTLRFDVQEWCVAFADHTGLIWSTREVKNAFVTHDLDAARIYAKTGE